MSTTRLPSIQNDPIPGSAASRPYPLYSMPEYPEARSYRNLTKSKSVTRTTLELLSYLIVWRFSSLRNQSQSALFWNLPGESVADKL